LEEIKALRSEIMALNSDIAVLESGMTTLQSRRAEYGEAIEQMSARVEVLEAERTKLTLGLAFYDQQISKLSPQSDAFVGVTATQTENREATPTPALTQDAGWRPQVLRSLSTDIADGLAEESDDYTPLADELRQMTITDSPPPQAKPEGDEAYREVLPPRPAQSDIPPHTSRTDTEQASVDDVPGAEQSIADSQRKMMDQQIRELRTDGHWRSEIGDIAHIFLPDVIKRPIVIHYLQQPNRAVERYEPDSRRHVAGDAIHIGYEKRIGGDGVAQPHYQMLDQDGQVVVNIQPDGNCLFRCLVYAQNSGLVGNEEGAKHHIMALRQEAADWLLRQENIDWLESRLHMKILDLFSQENAHGHTTV
ncbi:MAG: hypothetical protein ACR2RE_05215, partial [Geminicoccaceae bacterium]